MNTLMDGITVKRFGKKTVVTVQKTFDANPFDTIILRERSQEFLVIDPLRSKLAAAVLLGLKYLPTKESVVLYLGASAGYSVSFLGHLNTLVFAVEKAPEMARELIFNVQSLPTVAPILADASHPESYLHRLCAIDVLIQDVSQKNQARIFVDNLRLFLQKGGIGILFLKARSIDFAKDPADIFKKIVSFLRQQNGLEVLQTAPLERYHKGHFMIVVKHTC